MYLQAKEVIYINYVYNRVTHMSWLRFDSKPQKAQSVINAEHRGCELVHTYTQRVGIEVSPRFTIIFNVHFFLQRTHYYMHGPCSHRYTLKYSIKLYDPYTPPSPTKKTEYLRLLKVFF